MTTTINGYLSFEHDIIGMVRVANRTYVAWSRNHPHHPFGTHEINPDGTCETGRYFERRGEALSDLFTRAARWLHDQ